MATTTAIKISKIAANAIKDKVIYQFKKTNNDKNNKYLTSNSAILTIYYKYGTLLCFFINICIVYNIFTRDVIYCKDGHGFEDEKLRYAMINFCLSYPQLNNDDDSEFVLFYKWIPWVMTLLCVLFYSPKFVINFSSCDYTAKCLRKLNDNEEKEDSELLLDQLIKTRWNKSKRIYFGCLLCHFYTLILNVFIFFLLDFLLQGRFLLYIPKTFPFERDPLNFSDEMTQIFYPFIRCTIKTDLIQLGREEVLLCHLTLMEYYEKIFFILWIYLVIALLCISGYIIFLLLFLGRNNCNSFFQHIMKQGLNFNLYLLSKQKMSKFY